MISCLRNLKKNTKKWNLKICNIMKIIYNLKLQFFFKPVFITLGSNFVKIFL